MGKIIKRQIRYNTRLVEFGEQISNPIMWTIFILNEPTKIAPLKEKLAKVLNVVVGGSLEDMRILAKGKISGSGGLHYEAFALRCSKTDLTYNERKIVYGGEFKRDRMLRDKVNDVWFEEVYLPSLLGRKKEYKIEIIEKRTNKLQDREIDELYFRKPKKTRGYE